MEVFFVPFISSISKHETLVTSTEVVFVLVLMHCASNFQRLGLDVQDNVHVCTVKPDFIACVANLLAHIASDLLEVDLVLCDSINFAE